MTLPNFLIVGAMKAGTTWLSFNLENHPQVFIPKSELHFFNNETNFNKGFRWYEKKFENTGSAIAIGEKTAGYLLHKMTPKTISKSLPNVKILIVLREPVKRAISQINHHIRYAEASPNLDPDNLLGSTIFTKVDKEFAILERGRYFDQIKRYYESFEPSQLLVLINEIDIQKSPGQTLVKTCEFLGIDASFNFPLKNNKIHENRNSKLGTSLAYRVPILRPLIAKVDRFIPGKKVPPFVPSDTEIKKMYSFYQDENRKLFEFLDREVPESWKM